MKIFQAKAGWLVKAQSMTVHRKRETTVKVLGGESVRRWDSGGGQG